MRSSIGFFGTALACLLASGTASADISYSYNAAAMTPQGRLDGAFTVTEAAIADGSITIDEISINFALSDVSSPFTPTTFTPAELGPFIYSLHFGEIYVDRSSGQYLSQFGITANDAGTGQILQVGSSGSFVDFGEPGNLSRIRVDTPPTVTGGGTGAGSGGPGGGPDQNITYTFAATGATTPLVGLLNGSFSVPKAAILDGIIVFDDIIDINFSLTDATAPNTPRTFTRANFQPRFFGLRETPEIRVNPVSGAFLHDFWMTTVPGTGQLSIFPYRYLVMNGPTTAPGGRGELSVTVSGGGTPTGVATPAAVPALHPLVLASMLAMFGLIGARVLRRRHS